MTAKASLRMCGTANRNPSITCLRIWQLVRRARRSKRMSSISTKHLTQLAKQSTSWATLSELGDHQKGGNVKNVWGWATICVGLSLSAAWSGLLAYSLFHVFSKAFAG